MIVFLTAVLAAAALFFFGYTNFRLPVRRKAGKTHVACVGDSITYGCALPLFFRRRYPAVLQRLLGPDYQVSMFGVNDRTLQSTGNKPFRREGAFRQSLAFRPEVVVILLGTNDSKDRNWISKEAFHRQYGELIAAYRALPSHPRILLCTPPCAFPPLWLFSFCTKPAMIERIPMIGEEVRAVAQDEGVGLLDLYALTEGKPELFGPDGLHPSAQGARLVAAEVCRTLKSTEREA